MSSGAINFGAGIVFANIVSIFLPTAAEHAAFTSGDVKNTIKDFSNIDPQELKLAPEERAKIIDALSTDEAARRNFHTIIGNWSELIAAADQVAEAEEGKQALISELSGGANAETRGAVKAEAEAVPALAR